MMMGDFITLNQLGLPVKVVVLNNGTLGFVEMEMKASGLLDNGVDLKNPNFAAMAEAMGIKGVRVEKPQDLKGALTAAFSHDGPALVDVVSARQELIMPPKTTFYRSAAFRPVHAEGRARRPRHPVGRPWPGSIGCDDNISRTGFLLRSQQN